MPHANQRCNRDYNRNKQCTSEKEDILLKELRCKRNSNFVIIRISNSCDRKPKYINNILVSSKNTPGMHGIGTRSIKRVVAKYNGNLEMKYDNDTKTFTSVIGINSNLPSNNQS